MKRERGGEDSVKNGCSLREKNTREMQIRLALFFSIIKLNFYLLTSYYFYFRFVAGNWVSKGCPYLIVFFSLSQAKFKRTKESLFVKVFFFSRDFIDNTDRAFLKANV